MIRITRITRMTRSAGELPLELSERPPGPGFVRAPLPDGEGVHTGGPFISPDDQSFWKPLDARPYPNAPCRVPTCEDVVLSEMRDVPGFRSTWRVEEANGRRWLVRPRAYVIPEDWPAVTPEHVLLIEAGLRELNARDWELGDALLRVAIAADTYEPFVLDLSTAHRVDNPTTAPHLRADDSACFVRWAGEVAGALTLVQVRHHARQVIPNAAWLLSAEGRAHRRHRWVYGSPLRPISSVWARLPGEPFYLPADRLLTGMHTWVLVPEPLPAADVARYELVWGWGPILYQSTALARPTAAAAGAAAAGAPRRPADGT